MRCLLNYPIFLERDPMRLMKDEEKALLAASDAGGAYVKTLGKTDMALFSRSEWMLMMQAIVTAFTDKLQALRTQDDVPF